MRSMFKPVGTLAVILVLIASNAVASAPKSHSLKMKRAQKVSASAQIGKQAEIKSNLDAATKLAEGLDQRADVISEMAAMGRFEKWRKGLDETKLRAEYSQELLMHMSRMTWLFKTHREMGHFQKLNEFEFQTLLVKSDFIFSLRISRQCLNSAIKDSSFARQFAKALMDYNRERSSFDSKMIRFAMK